jgi:nitrogen regulatory protein P-II 1
MKCVEAWISPARLEDITERLRMIGAPGMTVHPVREPGGPPRIETYRGAVMTHDLATKLRLMIVVPDDLAEGVASAIKVVVTRDPADDGWIFVSPIDEAIRIRTEEHGPDAL